MLSIASRLALVNVNELNIPAIDAKPSPLKCPAGIVVPKTDVDTRFPFSKACTVSVPATPAVAKSNDTLLRSSENEIPKGPVWVLGLQSS